MVDIKVFLFEGKSSKIVSLNSESLNRLGKMDVSIVVPTYNERENVQLLIQRIDQCLRKKHNFELIVVDDNSPDGTWKAVEALIGPYPVKMVRRENERGLATAVLKGIETARTRACLIMDADLQHPPEKIPEMLRWFNRGYEIVIASRYVPGGEIRNWSIRRRVVSSTACILARLLFPKLKTTRDPISGFFLIDKQIIKDVPLSPVGFKILTEILILGNYKKVKEVPYIFENRKYGHSSLNFREILSYLKHLYILLKRSGQLGRIFKFGCVGLSGIVVNMAVLFILTELVGLYYLISGIFAFQSALISNFIFNDLWTFRDKNIGSLWGLGRFELMSLGGKFTNLSILFVLTKFLGFYYLLSNLVAILVASLVNFLGYQHFVWTKDKINK